MLLSHHHGLAPVTLTPAHETLVLAARAKLIFASFVHHELLSKVGEHGFLALIQLRNKLLANAVVSLEVLSNGLLTAHAAFYRYAAALLLQMFTQRGHGKVSFVA